MPEADVAVVGDAVVGEAGAQEVSVALVDSGGVADLQLGDLLPSGGVELVGGYGRASLASASEVNVSTTIRSMRVLAISESRRHQLGRRRRNPRQPQPRSDGDIGRLEFRASQALSPRHRAAASCGGLSASSPSLPALQRFWRSSCNSSPRIRLRVPWPCSLIESRAMRGLVWHAVTERPELGALPSAPTHQPCRWRRTRCACRCGQRWRLGRSWTLHRPRLPTGVDNRRCMPEPARDTAPTT